MNGRSSAQMKLSPEQRRARAQKANAKRQEVWRQKQAENIVSAAWDDLTKAERRARILNEQDHACAMCRIPQEWNGAPLGFELDHISGDRQDESRENLRLVCPNCHSQTPTYKSKNNPVCGQTRYTDDEIVDALLSETSVYKALEKLGMNPHGGNYTRVRKIVTARGLLLPYGLL